MVDQPIRVGIVGLGGIVRQRHIPGLRTIPGVQLVAVSNSTPESTQHAAQEFGIGRTFERWQDLVAWDGLDAVLIGTPPYLHREVTIAALDANKHVFCQARMAMNAADARLMLARAERSDRTTMLCPPPHFMRGDRVMRRLIADGFLGDLYHITVRWYSDEYGDRQAPLHWRQDQAISGVNTLTVGMLAEVTQRWVGDARRVAARAFTATPERPGADGRLRKVDRPDAITVAADMVRGGLGSFLFSGIAHHPGPNSVELYGSAGTIKYDYQADRILGARAGDADLQEIPIPPQEARSWTVEADFIAAIRSGNRTPEPSFADGVRYMDFTEGIFRSAEQGVVVELPLTGS
jgi:predicted dehydrogenase